MATYTPVEMIATQYVANTATTYYTVPSSTKTIVKSIMVCNTDTVSRDVTIHNVPNGGSAQNSNMIVPTVAIPAKGVVIFETNHLMPTSATLRALASASSTITITAAGVEIV